MRSKDHKLFIKSCDHLPKSIQAIPNGTTVCLDVDSDDKIDLDDLKIINSKHWNITVGK